jgi:hypothetical protein
MARDPDALCRAIEAHLGLTTRLIFERAAQTRPARHRKAAG